MERTRYLVDGDEVDAMTFMSADVVESTFSGNSYWEKSEKDGVTTIRLIRTS
jgi:hypothetical protein